MKKRKVQASSFAPIADDHILEVRNLKVDIAVDDYILNAVRGVTFSLKKGETLGLVGESGCGKSVTSKEILGINPSNCRSEGEILYRTKSGKVVNLLTLERNGAEFRAIRGAENLHDLSGTHDGFLPSLHHRQSALRDYSPS